MVIKFYGFRVEEVIKLMPKVVQHLGLNHDYYTAAVIPEAALFDKSGTLHSNTNAIEVPPFAGLTPDKLLGLSEALRSMPVTSIIGGKVVLAIYPNVY